MFKYSNLITLLNVNIPEKIDHIFVCIVYIYGSINSAVRNQHLPLSARHFSLKQNKNNNTRNKGEFKFQLEPHFITNDFRAIITFANYYKNNGYDYTCYIQNETLKTGVFAVKEKMACIFFYRNKRGKCGSCVANKTKCSQYRYMSINIL